MNGGDLIRRALDVLAGPRQVVELRALKTRKGTVRGYFDDYGKLADCAAKLSDDGWGAEGVYVTLNVVDRALLARSANCVEYGRDLRTTSDNNITRRRWVLIDIDPTRPSGISSTDLEKLHAFAIGRRLREWLREQGWPVPIVADSGNGVHLLYRIDEPNDAETATLIRRFLDALAHLFSDEKAKVDRTCFNASRIVKLYGTTARKGSSIPERPHRISEIVETPETIEIVPRELIEEIAAQAPEPETLDSQVKSANGPAVPGQRFDLNDFVSRHLDVQRIEPWQGGRRFILNHCPFDASHTGTSVAIIQMPSGAPVFACKHDGCSDKRWPDVRELFEAGYRGRHASALVRNGAQVPPATTSSTPQTAEKGVTTRMSDVEPEEVEWLWPDRLALGKLNLLVGDPGNGKSFATLDIAARVSIGANFPDGATCPKGSVIIITGEDGIADTVRPRLDAQGADATRVHHFKIKRGDSERQFDIGADLDRLKGKIREIGDVRLLIIDPLTAYLGDVDSNKDAKVRGLLTPLAALAEEMRVAILGVMHLNKAAVMDAIYRVTGSVAFIAQARAAWAVVPDSRDSSRRLFLKLKANLAPADIPGLAFTIDAKEGGRPLLTWSDEAVTVSLRDVMGGFSNTRRGPKPDKLEAAKALIAKILGDGAEHPGADLDAAAKAEGISIRTLNDAAKALGVRRRKDGFAGGWLWSMTQQENSASSPDSNGNSASSMKPAENKAFSQDRNSASSSANSEGAEFIGNGESLHLGEQEGVEGDYEEVEERPRKMWGDEDDELDEYGIPKGK